MRGLRHTLFLPLVLWPALGLGQQLVLLGPPGAVSPDGFAIAVAVKDARGALLPAAAELSAQNGQVHAQGGEGALQTFSVVPEPNAREVKLVAAASGLRAEATFTVGPPASRVDLSLEPATPVKGRDTSAKLTVRLLKADGSVDRESPPPVIRTNVGRIDGLSRSEDGAYRATYVLPETRYPEVAVLVAFAPWPEPASVYGSMGALRVPLATSISLPGVTEPNAQMSLELAGKTFGPVTASPRGEFHMDVVVPPGYRYAKGLAVDRAGNRRTSTLDLALPPTDQLACVMNPARLPADGVSRARIVCAASDPYGKAVASAKVSMTARRGSLFGPHIVSGDLLEWIYTAPRPPSVEPDALQGSFKQAGPLSREELAVELVQGPAVKLQLTVADKLVHRGGQTAVSVHAMDTFGKARPGAVVATDASVGATSGAEEKSPGQHQFTWSIPEDARPARGSLGVSVFGPLGKDPAAIAAWLEAGQLALAVLDPIGAPVPGQPLLVGDRTVRTGADGTVRVPLPAVGEGVLVGHAQWPGISQRFYRIGEAAIFPAAGRPGSPLATASVELAPPVPVNVRLQISGRDVTYWVEDPKGNVLPDRRVSVALSSGVRSGEDVRSGRRHFTVSSPSPASVSVADLATGVTAVGVVRP